LIHSNQITIGIDASNIRTGGGVTHLIELLNAAQPSEHGFTRIVVWSGASTLSMLTERPWLTKRNPPLLNKGLLQRVFWQRYCLSQVARDEGCDVLFVPGGSYVGNFHPVVTMSQNLLPFEMRELRRYGFTLFTIKWLLLRLTQSRSFKKTEGVIFLTEYAREVVLKITGKLRGQTCIIPHGLNPRFTRMPKLQRDIDDYDSAHPYRILYVSTIDQYKHQWHVVEAVAILRMQGFPVVLDLVGSAYPPALQRLNTKIDQLDPERLWVHYHGAIPYLELHMMYAEVDVGIWASTCETFGIILLEAMASGLPIACSNKQPMPEIVGENAVYFVSEQVADIASALRKLIESPRLRTEIAKATYLRAQQYQWQRCADETFAFIGDVTKNNCYLKEIL
jgi:glycosyltransferase involved in cell wall biosynthesis